MKKRIQGETGRSGSFERLEQITRRTAPLLAVGWLWGAGAVTVASACERAGERDCERACEKAGDKA